MDAAGQAWEPSGTDILSPTLMQAECMRALLPRDGSWLGRFCRAWRAASQRRCSRR
ncbi:DUF2891 family protein [Bradyrhizobium sp. DASA03005]|uniref:DUF2891 family protein n=1 Tax=Bradyrhizobium sp. SPXBL-02 TaxID=3395912 RepID=UPI003F71760E